MSSALKENNIEIKSKDVFDQKLKQAIKSSSLSVLYFWADWHPPSKQLLAVVDETAKDYPNVQFLKIEAESYPEITEQYPVKSVPTSVFVQQHKVIEVQEGANVPNFVALVKKHADAAAAEQGKSSNPTNAPTSSPSSSSSSSTATTTSSSTSSSTPAPNKDDLNARLAKLVQASPMMLFMKGSPQEPKCKFSRQMVELLKEANATYGYFDILTDNDVREGLKEFSKWPTYPQLYIAGRLIGGVDICKDLHAEGELAKMLPKPNAQKDLNEKIKSLINKQRVMLFMKGSPEQPSCGFSSQIVGVLKEAGAAFGSFDILSDDEVRQGLKTYSNWPTYPQLYIDGKLVGGLDIVRELQENGELEPMLNPETK